MQVRYVAALLYAACSFFVNSVYFDYLQKVNICRIFMLVALSLLIPAIAHSKFRPLRKIHPPPIYIIINLLCLYCCVFYYVMYIYNWISYFQTENFRQNFRNTDTWIQISNIFCAK